MSGDLIKPSGPPAAELGPVGFARKLVNRALAYAVRDFLSRGIVRGTVRLVEADVGETVFGESLQSSSAAGRPCVTLQLSNSQAFFSRVALSADIGFAEAYIAGDFTVENPEELVSMFRLLILNRDEQRLSASSLAVAKVGSLFNSFVHTFNANSLAGSRRNIQAHYDLSNDLFATFLGPSWTYSCGIFRPDGNFSLDEAQYTKLDMIIEKARLGPDCHVVEIGCGWGEFAIRAAKKTGCRVTGVTLSEEQLSLARERARESGVSDLVQFDLVDYRNLPKSGVLYDRVVSIEMLEAVGHEYLPEFFRTVDSIMAPHGIAVIQVITTPEQRYEEYRTSVDFIQKYIFPGGICPSIEAIVSAMAKGSDMCLEHAENIGPHYATTLKAWRLRFLESVRCGDVDAAGFDEVFVRTWIYYFCYCEAGFASRTLGNMQLVLSRTGNVQSLGRAPQGSEDISS